MPRLSVDFRIAEIRLKSTYTSRSGTMSRCSESSITCIHSKVDPSYTIALAIAIGSWLEFFIQISVHRRGVLARAAMAWQCADTDTSDRIRTTFVLSGPCRLFVDCCECDGISLVGQAGPSPRLEGCAQRSPRGAPCAVVCADTTAVILHLNPA